MHLGIWPPIEWGGNGLDAAPKTKPACESRKSRGHAGRLDTEFEAKFAWPRGAVLARPVRDWITTQPLRG
ncbi:MAG: hypothetical protein DWH81_11125 [Planctomycetota bacterium]|nr:MAG: hypothetical protein DWH81_11125 [Planctomycetota bacterium]